MVFDRDILLDRCVWHCSVVGILFGRDIVRNVWGRDIVWQGGLRGVDIIMVGVSIDW